MPDYAKLLQARVVKEQVAVILLFFFFLLCASAENYYIVVPQHVYTSVACFLCFVQLQAQ